VKYEVRFRPGAEADLAALYDYIRVAAGPRVASEYLARIEATCLALETFPERGTRRDDLAPGLRTLGFERRVTIAFRVLGFIVEIVAIA
jgi:toxin ParE1/3/4